MLKQRLLAVLLVSSLCVAPAGAAAATFSDVTPDSLPWAYEAVEAFAQKGILDGVGNGRFAPKELVTREQFAKMLALTFALDAKADPSADSATDPLAFRDVTADTLPADSIQYIQSVQPYFPGYTNTDGSSFLPKQVATREEITAACVRVLSALAGDARTSSSGNADAPDGDSDTDAIAQTFSDYASISGERRADVATALRLGLVEGYEDGTFRPQAGVNRAQTVVILNRALAVAQDQADQSDSSTPLTPSTPAGPADSSDQSDTSDQAGSSAATPSTPSDPATASDDATDSASGAESKPESKPEPEPEPESSSAETQKPSSSTGSPTGGNNKPSGSSHSTGSANVYEIGEFYGYVLYDPYRTSVDGEQLSAVTIWTGEEEKDMRLQGSLPPFRAGSVLHYTLMSDGSVRHVGEVRGHVGALLQYSDDQKKVAILTEETGLAEYEITEDSTVLYVDSEERVGEYGSLQKAKEVEGGYLNNVWFFAYGDEIDCLVVDVNNELQ